MSKLLSPVQPIITFAEQCDRGMVREENQDSVRHGRIALGDVFIVADGIGGYKGGAVASRMVAEGFYNHLAALPPTTRQTRPSAKPRRW
jgi:protein phosphatase